MSRLDYLARASVDGNMDGRRFSGTIAPFSRIRDDMKILLVTMQYGQGYVQGTERYVTTLSQCLRDRGHQTAILAGDPLHQRTTTRLGERVEHDADTVYHYPTRGWMTVEGLSPRRLRTWLRQQRPDLVHLNTPAHIGHGVLAAARSLGIPTVVTVHDYWWCCPKATLLRGDGRICDGTPPWPECIRCIGEEHHRPAVRNLARRTSLSSPLLLALCYGRAVLRGMVPADMVRWLHRRELLRVSLNETGYVIFPSQAMGRVMTAGLRHDRWKVIPNGLTPEWFEHRKPPPARAVPPEELTIGYAGAMMPHKAPHLLLEAVRQLGWSHTRIRLAGPTNDAGYWSKMQNTATGLNMDYVGQLDRNAMAPFLRSLNLLVMTSIWPENYPYIVLEAHAAGVPVVGSRTGGITDQIEDANLLYEPGSVNALAASLKYARENLPSLKPARVSTADEMTDATLAGYSVASEHVRR